VVETDLHTTKQSTSATALSSVTIHHHVLNVGHGLGLGFETPKVDLGLTLPYCMHVHAMMSYYGPLTSILRGDTRVQRSGSMSALWRQNPHFTLLA